MFGNRVCGHVSIAIYNKKKRHREDESRGHVSILHISEKKDIVKMSTRASVTLRHTSCAACDARYIQVVHFRC